MGIAADTGAWRGRARREMTRHDVRTRSRLAGLGIGLMRIGMIAVLAFLILSKVATLVVAGTAVSVLWFRSVLRKLGLRLRFAPA